MSRDGAQPLWMREAHAENVKAIGLHLWSKPTGGSNDTGLQTAGIKTIVGKLFTGLRELLRLIDQDAIERIVESLSTARENGAMIYVAGNGGSAAIASHWVNDLGKATKRSGFPPIRVMSLNDNMSWLTALANDEGYERVFLGNSKTLLNQGDVLVVISSSGNSVNLIRAVELARTRGLVTIGLLGSMGAN